MRECLLWRLIPNTPFHLGSSEGAGSGVIAHSDTLFSAIMNSYRLIYGYEELEAFLEKYLETPLFTITSAFPYIRDTNLFPIPKGLTVSALTQVLHDFKKTRFVSESIFRKIIEGSVSKEDFNRDNLVKDKQVLLGSDEAEKYKDLKLLWVERERPRVTIDREHNSSQIYHVSETIFENGCGLFFLMDLKDDSISRRIEASIRLLGDEGLGGERTYGYGLFEVNKKDYSIPDGGGNLYSTLSLVYPSKDQLYGLIGKYSLLKRGGWIFSQDGRNFRRRTVRMFEEGSTFNKPIPGILQDVKPEGFTFHHVFCYGLGFYVNIEGSL